MAVKQGLIPAGFQEEDSFCYPNNSKIVLHHVLHGVPPWKASALLVHITEIRTYTK